MDEKNLEILNLLAENERAVARLYKCFSEKNEINKEFWKKLVEEEMEHAQWVEELKPGVEEGAVKINHRKFPVEMLERSIGSMKEIIDRAENNALSFADYSEQLEVAHELERGMIEKKFFKAFDADDDLVKALLKKLKDATNEHQQRIKSEWKQNK